MSYEYLSKRLENEGFETYLVGGAVRDRLLGKEIHDIDLTTRARPNDIMRIFSDLKLIDIGKKFGTIKVIYKSEEFEITSFRSESTYKDRRHPEKISFSDSIDEDLKRRDFTINAMAFRNGELIDLFGGQKDLQSKLIMAVGNPYERIKEDYLRAIRAVRFATILDFEIESELKKAISQMASHIEDISKERIRDEVDKILLADNPSRGIRLLDDLNLLEYIFPEVKSMIGFDQHSSHHNLDLFEHSMKVLESSPKNLKTRMAALFHDTGKIDTFFIDKNGEGRFFGHQEISEKIIRKRLKTLKYPKKFIENTALLVERHMDNTNTYTKKSVRKLLRKVGEENIYDLFDLQKADVLATVHDNTENIILAKKLLEEVLNSDVPRKEDQIDFSGKDLIELGFEQGKELGMILKEIYSLVMDEKLINKKSEIIKYIKNKYINLDRN
ncbi:HD domain-containing protein [Anaerococcus hydrogenalis]|uniref:CCA tRNA nucleotidyltransferase n=1 Tax=Anaerococcus hydrogenalis TaxID=33029 RepID=UPI0029018EB1|nr:HD domain-containing protein [Anaerococcus hydrogenalis]MDU1315622.1 HD domain-containing protein [Anaerococcus hydrogenalis]